MTGGPLPPQPPPPVELDAPPTPPVPPDAFPELVDVLAPPTSPELVDVDCEAPLPPVPSGGVGPQPIATTAAISGLARSRHKAVFEKDNMEVSLESDCLKAPRQPSTKLGRGNSRKLIYDMCRRRAQSMFFSLLSMFLDSVAMLRNLRLVIQLTRRGFGNVSSS